MITNKVASELLLSKKGSIVVCDWDDVIQNTSLIWAWSILEKYNYFKDYFKLGLISDKKEIIDNINNRSEYYLNKWLLKGKVDSKKEKTFLNLYTKDDDFYNRLNYTIFAGSLFMALKSNYIEKIYFLTHCPLEMNGFDGRKYEQINKIISKYHLEKEKDRIELVCLPINLSKAKWIKSHVSNYDIFIDDRPDIVLDVIKNTKSENKTFLIPKYGYSDLSDNLELSSLSLTNRIVLNYGTLV